MDRFTRLIAIGVIALVIVGLAVVLIRERAAPPVDLSTPRGTVIAYLEALRNGEPDRAYELLDSSARQQVTLARFSQQVSFLRNDQRRVEVGEATLEGERARVPVTFRYPGDLFSSGGRDPRTALLVRESGAWRISSPPEPFLGLREP